MAEPSPLSDGFSVLALPEVLELRFALRPRSAAHDAEVRRVLELVLSDSKRFGYYANVLALAVRELLASRDRARVASEHVQPLETLRDFLR